MSAYATRFLEFAVTGQRIEVAADTPPPVNESREYLQAHFTVDAAWDGLTIHAIFYNEIMVAAPVPLDETLTCPVPAAALEKPASWLRVGLVGYGSDGYRLTTDRAEIDIDQAAYSPGQTPKPPTPDVYGALLDAIFACLPMPPTAAVGQAIAVDTVDESGRVTAVKAVDFPQGGGGSVTPEQIAEAVASYLEQNPVEVGLMTAETIGGAKLGDNLKLDAAGRLSVDTTDEVASDNTKPITAAAVHTTVGNIEILLKTI